MGQVIDAHIDGSSRVFFVTGSIMWKNRGPPEEKKTYVT